MTSQFTNFGRMFGVISALALPSFALWQIGDSASIKLDIYSLLLVPVIGLIEIPSFCKCFKWCVILESYLRFTKLLVFRGLFHWLAAAGGYTIYTLYGQNIFLLIPYMVLTLAGLCYIIAFVRREEGFSSLTPKTMEVVSDSKSKSTFSSFFGSSKETEKPASVKLLDEASASAVPAFTGNSGYGSETAQYSGASGATIFGGASSPVIPNTSNSGYSAPVPSSTTESFKPTETTSSKGFYDEEVNPFAG
jgi:hypothetical protein